MAKYVALLRGINVGGHKRMPMKQLAKALDGVGFRKIETVLQSGNVVLESAQRSESAVEKRMRGAIEEEFGFDVRVMVRTEKAFSREAASNPFTKAAEEDPKTVHFFFRRTDEPIDKEALRRLQGTDERVQAKGAVLYLHAPSGIGRSKLVARIEEVAGEATARNARTVSRLLNLL